MLVVLVVAPLDAVMMVSAPRVRPDDAGGKEGEAHERDQDE